MNITFTEEGRRASPVPSGGGVPRPFPPGRRGLSTFPAGGVPLRSRRRGRDCPVPAGGGRRASPFPPGGPSPLPSGGRASPVRRGACLSRSRRRLACLSRSRRRAASCPVPAGGRCLSFPPPGGVPVPFPPRAACLSLSRPGGLSPSAAARASPVPLGRLPLPFPAAGGCLSRSRRRAASCPVSAGGRFFLAVLRSPLPLPPLFLFPPFPCSRHCCVCPLSLSPSRPSPAYI